MTHPFAHSLLAVQAGGAFGSMGPFLFQIGAIMLIVYFLIIRPQRKKQQELTTQINSLKGGDSIVTTGGIHGIISSLQEKTLSLKIADNVKIKIDKSAVAAVIKRSAEADVIEVSTDEEKA